MFLEVGIGSPEIVGIATLSGLVVTSCFGLLYFVIKSAREERREERATRAEEAKAHLAAFEALRHRSD